MHFSKYVTFDIQRRAMFQLSSSNELNVDLSLLYHQFKSFLWSDDVNQCDQQNVDHFKINENDEDDFKKDRNNEDQSIESD